MIQIELSVRINAGHPISQLEASEFPRMCNCHVISLVLRSIHVWERTFASSRDSKRWPSLGGWGDACACKIPCRYAEEESFIFLE